MNVRYMLFQAPEKLNFFKKKRKLSMKKIDLLIRSMADHDRK